MRFHFSRVYHRVSSPTMRTIRFTKKSKKADRVTFFSGMVTLAEIDNPKQAILPHDMVHFAVEKSFPYKGFITLIFEGHPPQFAMAITSEAWLVEALVEAFQASLWSGFPNFADYKQTVANICSMRNAPTPDISEKHFASCTELMKTLTDSWNRLEVGQSLSLDF